MMENYWQVIKLSSTLITSFLASIAYSSVLWAQPVTSSSNSPKFTPPPPPPDRGAAGDRGGAASRGCGNDKQPLIALVPDYQQIIKLGQEETIPITKVWGLTTAQYPTFWFFIPYDKSSITTMELVIKDESQRPSKTLYRTFLKKPEMPGVVGIPMSTTIQPLEISQTKHQKMYHWFFKVRVKCNPEQPTELRTVEGWIERISPSSTFANRLKQVTPLQQVALYAENGIWYDALTTLAELRLTKPKDASLLANWKTLLESEDLEDLADRPLIDCCKPN